MAPGPELLLERMGSTLENGKERARRRITLPFFRQSAKMSASLSNCRGSCGFMCGTSHKTQELVALAQGGDEPALERLYRVYAERVRWMVRLRMGKALRGRLESMDLVQDVLVHAFQGLGNHAQ